MQRDAQSDWQLPVDQERLWAVLEQDDTGRGRRNGLTLRAIVGAGIEIADRDGLAEVTMAAIASKLGFSTMALYRHLPNKAVLLVLMVDTAVAEPPELPDGGHWRDSIETLAMGIAQVYRRHPWLLDVPISGPPATPNNVRWMEAGMASLRETHLPLGDRLGIWMLLAAYVRGESLLSLQLERGKEMATEHGSYAEFLRRLTGTGKFPEVTRAIESGMFDDTTVSREENEAEFAFGLALFLDGVAAHIERAKKGGGNRG